MDIELAKARLHKFLGDKIYLKVMKAMKANFINYDISDLIIQTNRETCMNPIALERIIFDETDFFSNYYKQNEDLLYRLIDAR